MKKTVCLLFLFLFLLSSCGAIAEPPAIEEIDWQMDAIQDDGGRIIAFDPAHWPESAPESAKTVHMTCEAADGKLELRDTDSGKSYAGTYRRVDRSPDSTRYTVTLNGTDGYAVSAMTTYADESRRSTLIFRIGKYTLHFSGDLLPAQTEK